MLSEIEREALDRWYARAQVLDEAKRLYQASQWHEIEDWLHMTVLLPLSKVDELPDYLRTEEGEPLFPSKLDPRVDREKWQDAIEVGWAVVQRELGFDHEEIHRRIAEWQKQDWEAFVARADALAAKERGEK